MAWEDALDADGIRASSYYDHEINHERDPVQHSGVLDDPFIVVEIIGINRQHPHEDIYAMLVTIRRFVKKLCKIFQQLWRSLG